MSRASLWTDLSCEDTDKTRVYLGRSKASPIDLCLSRVDGLSPHDPFLTLVPDAIRQLRSVVIFATPRYLQDITDHLSHPTPLLERLSVDTEHEFKPVDKPILAPALFDGDLSSLCVLHLQSVRTELPWRNMVNLTSFTLGRIEVSVRHLLDFFESASRLRVIELDSATPTSGAQNGRSVSLDCLKKMGIDGGEPPSLLLDHLLIPTGAKLAIRSPFRGSPVEANLPRSLGNLKNLSNFTKIDILLDELFVRMQFTGPNGGVLLESLTDRVDITSVVLESLAQFDTSDTRWLEISCANPPSRDLSYRVLLPMKNLHTFTLIQYTYPHAFVDALHPSLNPAGVVVCPKLEELAITLLDGVGLDTKSMIAMAAARASRGAKLRTVRISDGWSELRPRGVLELRKHVLRVEYGPGVCMAQRSDDEEVSDDSDGASDDSEGASDGGDDGSDDGDEEE